MRKKKKSNKLTDEQLYSVPEDRQLYKECKYCRCSMCRWWADDCRTCAVCLLKPYPFTKCVNFEPFIFGSEPYKSYIAELDKNREKRRFYVD